MLVADSYLGHRDDPEVAELLDGADSLGVTVNDTERRRSRVRTTADDGTDLGIVVGRELRDGDVLETDGRPVVISLAAAEALVVDCSAVGGSTTAVLSAVELGHAAGNRHWDLAVEDQRAYLPLTEERDRMESAIRPHLPAGATITTDAVSPALFDDADYGPSGDHGHSHGDGDHAHSHDHGEDGHTHTIREIDPEGQS